MEWIQQLKTLSSEYHEVLRTSAFQQYHSAFLILSDKVSGFRGYSGSAGLLAGLFLKGLFQADNSVILLFSPRLYVLFF